MAKRKRKKGTADNHKQKRKKIGASDTSGYKREEYISWKEYFMGVAILSGKRSKDPDTQVGACIVDKEKRIVGVGYNGMPVGNEGELAWWKNGNAKEVCHAAMSAIVNKNPTSMKNCTLYITHFPCNECSKIVIQSGIKEVIYLYDENRKKKHNTASRILLDNANVKHEEYSKESNRQKHITLIYEEKPESSSNNPDDPDSSDNNEEEDPEKRILPCARDDYISNEKFFMGIAILSCERSKDKQTQVGACVVDDENKIVGVGYNGMPVGCSDDLLPWKKITEKNKSGDKYWNKHLYVCHAEMNAIVNKNPTSMKNCTLYVTLFPCIECAKIVIQSGIKKVIYLSFRDEEKYVKSKKLLRKAKVTMKEYSGTPKSREEIRLIYKKENPSDR